MWLLMRELMLLNFNHLKQTILQPKTLKKQCSENGVLDEKVSDPFAGAWLVDKFDHGVPAVACQIKMRRIEGPVGCDFQYFVHL